MIITVDTGITAIAETDYASGLGTDLVVTDHHCCGAELPRACAVVNPHRADSVYPFKDLAGVGVAFKLVCALEKTFSPDEKYIHRVCADYGDLAAVGTIADVMPLFGENRLIVSIGLKLIEEGRNFGFEALCAAADNNAKASEQNRRQKKRKVNSTYIRYTIAPTINAAGRIRKASVAVELLTTENKCRAREIAGTLCDINRERQEYENTIIEEACDIIERTHDFSHDRVIVISSEDWHHGVIGIAASRITERYGLPSVLISFDGGHTESEASDEDIGRGGLYHFQNGQLGSGVNNVCVKLGFPRPNVLRKPGKKLFVVANSLKQAHGGMRVQIIKTRKNRFPAAINNFVSGRGFYFGRNFLKATTGNPNVTFFSIEDYVF